MNNPLSGTDPSGYAVCKTSDSTRCLEDGPNTVTDQDGKESTVIVAKKGDRITVSRSNGASFSGTFTGKSGVISNVLNGKGPSSINEISQRTNGTLERIAFSQGLGPDAKRASLDDFGAKEEGIAAENEWAAQRSWNFAHQGLEPVPLLGVEMLLQGGKGVANEYKQTGGISVETAATMSITPFLFGFGGRTASVARSGGATSLSPSMIRFSQSSVNGVEEITASMKANGWQGAPIDVVRMGDGMLTSFDNSRLLAAHRAGINVQAVVREAGDSFPANRWTPRSGVQPATWGGAINARIQQQNSKFRNTYPNGSPYTGSAQ